MVKLYGIFNRRLIMTNGQETAVVQQAKPEVRIGASGIQLRTLDELYRFAKAVHQSKLCPAGDTEQAIVVKMQYGMELGLKGPVSALKNIFVVNNRPAVFGSATLGLVYQSGFMESICEYIEGEGDDMVAICKTKRKGMTEITRTFSVADAKAAQLWGKAGPWKQYKKRMLQYKARNLAMNDAFADVFMGIDIVEELQERDIVAEYDTASMPVTTPRDERTEDVPVTLTLDMAQKALMDEFDSQCRGISPDVASVDIQNAFFNFMATRFGGDVNAWTNLKSEALWTIKRCQESIDMLNNDGIPDSLARMYLGVKIEPETEPDMPMGEMFLPPDESEDNNG